MRTALVILAVVLMVGGVVAPVSAADSNASSADINIECEYPVTVEDATGTEITVEEPPDRVVTTNPSAAQVMWEIGAFERVVGLTEWALYLDGAEDRELISSNDEPIVRERVVDLEPDLILAPNATETETVEQLREVGLTVYHFPMAEDLDDVSEKTAVIGELAGECEGAEETLDWMDERLSIVEDAVEGEERPTALYMFFDFTVGSETFINELIEFAGGENVAAEAGIVGFQPISEEVVIDEDPEWIILNSDDPALPDTDAVNQTTAAQEDQVVIVEIEHLNQPAPRNVLAITTLVEHFHPEAFAEAEEAAIADDATDDLEEADDADGTESETVADEDDTIPGFGPVIALVAMLGAALWLRKIR